MTWRYRGIELRSSGGELQDCNREGMEVESVGGRLQLSDLEV
jgi:hypothetical protein